MAILDQQYDESAFVAVFDQDYNQLFTTASSMKVVVNETAKVMEHPVETGAMITDHRIILPVEIELSLILASYDYQDTYKQIRQFYLNATLLVVQTKSGIYNHQIISSMPHEESPEQFDVLVMALALKQVQFATAQYGIVPKSPKNTSTVRRGEQQTTPVAVDSSLSMAASSAWSGIKGLFGS